MMEMLCKLVPEMPELGLRTHLVVMLRLYDKFKATGHSNAYIPLFVPNSFL